MRANKLTIVSIEYIYFWDFFSYLCEHGFFLNQTKVYCNYVVGTHLNIELSDFCVFMVDIWFIFRYCSNYARNYSMFTEILYFIIFFKQASSCCLLTK